MTWLDRLASPHLARAAGSNTSCSQAKAPNVGVGPEKTMKPLLATWDGGLSCTDGRLPTSLTRHAFQRSPQSAEAGHPEPHQHPQEGIELPHDKDE